MLPVVQSRQQLRSEELPEFSFPGPFGGIQSELSPDLVENYGFLDALNIMFARGMASARPGVTALAALPSPSDEAIVGISDFFTSESDRIQTIQTPTRLLQFINADWTNIPPASPGLLTGDANNLFNWTVVNSKLLFSQGVDPVMLWDGIGATFDVASGDAVPARYLMELDTHLVVADLIEGGQRYTQRVRWTIPGDPTDWTSPGSGAVDILNNLGPIRGLCKLFQTGYAMHQLGITQIIPTGVGLAPFRFIPLTSKARGAICPYSIATNGEELACYVGKDNIYAFNGSSSEPIGDMPIDGRRRLGARRRIFADLQSGNPLQVLGYISENVNGVNYNAYWLVIPGISAWLFNFDEQNWTRFQYTKKIKTIGTFFSGFGVRIMDLIGTINDQLWSPDTLIDENPFDAMLLGSDDGTPEHVDFSTYSELPWSITGINVFNDTRHRKTIKKFRLCMFDAGPISVTVTVTNELGQSQTRPIELGTGSGKVLSQVVGFGIDGIRLTWVVDGVGGQPANFVEFAPIYDIGGEQRGGTVQGG